MKYLFLLLLGYFMGTGIVLFLMYIISKEGNENDDRHHHQTGKKRD